MQMGTRGVSGLSHITDHVSGIDLTPSTNSLADPRKVAIARDKIIGVADFHEIPIARAPAGKLNAPPANGHNGCSGGSRVIDGPMRADGTKDGMAPRPGESRRDARVTQWRAQKSAPQRMALLVVVSASLVAGDKIESRHGFAVGLQFGCKNAARRPPSVGIAGLFNDGGERIAGLKVGKKINFVFEHSRQIQNLLRRESGFNSILVKAVGDAAALYCAFPYGRDLVTLGGPPLRCRLDPYQIVFEHNLHTLHGFVPRIDNKLDIIPRAQFSRVNKRSDPLDQCVRQGSLQAV